MIEEKLSEERGSSDHGWLKAKFSFSFANYWGPNQIGFSNLLAINDDHIAPAKGFGKHPYKNMEILRIF